VAAADRISYPLNELNDLLTGANGSEIAGFAAPRIQDPYRLN